jgi:hypothetical protein
LIGFVDAMLLEKEGRSAFLQRSALPTRSGMMWVSVGMIGAPTATSAAAISSRCPRPAFSAAIEGGHLLE